jgi:hypothetical protein
VTRHQFGAADDPGVARPTSFDTRRTWLEVALDRDQRPGTPGWRRMTPTAEAGRDRCHVRPYLRPALDAAAQQAVDQLRGAGRDMMADMVEGLAAAEIDPRLEQAPPTGGRRLVRAQVRRIPQDPDDPELKPCWSWRCNTCGTQGNGCMHTVLHEPGSWRAAMCGGIHHVHTDHFTPRHPPGAAEHTTMLGRRRCDWSPPSERDLRWATWVLCGRQGMPHGDLPREIAREVLALAGRRTP